MKYAKCFAVASAAVMIVITVTLILAPSAWGQSKYKTLYAFSGGTDGDGPYALILDSVGVIYGTTGSGGAQQGGTVFKLTPNPDGSWLESVLHDFTGIVNGDGAAPSAGLIFDQAGNLYGTTYDGGAQEGGTVFKLTPNPNGNWTESVLHSFSGGDGAMPAAGLIFDQAGNLYGTTVGGGINNCGGFGCGVVFKLSPNPDGSWTESLAYSFNGGTDGIYPSAGVIFDKTGNLYGTKYGGAFNQGTVFELTPNADGSWKERVLHSFCSATSCRDGLYPRASLIFDAEGNLYGTTSGGGSHGDGVVFKLTPNQGRRWKESVLHSFCSAMNCNDGSGPAAGLIFDHSGNLYGTTGGGGTYGYGVVFKLAPNSQGGWNETVLHRFADHPEAAPNAGLIFDAAGNLYGTTYGDLSTTFGSVFEITP
jgi:uncharacterized repeat protein (TIGR03803 family)